MLSAEKRHAGNSVYRFQPVWVRTAPHPKQKSVLRVVSNMTSAAELQYGHELASGFWDAGLVWSVVEEIIRKSYTRSQAGVPDSSRASCDLGGVTDGGILK